MHVVQVIAGVLLILWGVAQLRMTLVYLGRVPSAVAGPSSSLAVTAGLSAVFMPLYGLLLIVLPWPQVVSYVLAAMLLRYCADEIAKIAGFGPGALQLTPKGKRYMLQLAAVGFIFRLAPVVLAVWLFGVKP